MPASSSHRPGEQQHGGVNWGLVVGGAVATVLSLAITRGSKSNRRTSKAAAAAAIHPEQPSNDLVLPVEAGDLMALRRESSSGSSSSGGAGAGGSGEISSDGTLQRDAVHRLRSQLKSRDAMIMEMQSELSSKEKALHSHASLVAGLERQLRDANDSIYEVERVIQGLHGSKGKPAAGSIEMGTQCSSDSDEEHRHRQEHQEHEAKKRLVVKNGEKKEMVLHAKEGDYQLVFERAKHLEAELVGIRAMAQEMASLLKMSEEERLRLHHVVSQLQQKLAFQAKELHTMRATTHFLTVGRRSADDYKQAAARLSKDDDANTLLKLEDPTKQTQESSRPKQRYADSATVNNSFEVSEVIDPEISRSSSAGSYWSSGGQQEQDLDGVRQSSGRLVDYRNFDSPGVVRIGSPTVMVASRSSVESGTAQRYLFSDDQQELDEDEEELDREIDAGVGSAVRSSTLEVVVEEEEGSSGSSSVMEEMLDDTLEDLVNATRPRATGIAAGRRSV